MLFFRQPPRAASTALATKLALGVLSAAGLTACAPDLGPAARITPAASYSAQQSLSDAPTAAAWPGQDWWKAYGDPQLDALIDEALKGSPDLKAAAARVREAQAQAEVAGAAQLPSVTAKGSIDATGINLNIAGIPSSAKNFLPTDVQPITQIGANLNYQLDFFGHNRAAVATASSAARAAEFELAAARLRVQAAAGKVKQAHADFYPNVNLAASVLDLSITPQDIITHNIVLAQAGPAINLPLFEGGRLTGAYRGARGEYDEAVANYDKAVVQSLHDVADAVSAQRGLSRQLEFAQKAAGASENAYALAMMRYKGGLSPYLTVLTAESNLLSQRRALADLQAQSLAANVALVRSLGGGFVDTDALNSKGPSHG